MRRAVRAIVINENKLLIMHRNKFGSEYDTLPGGNVEVGESFEQALYRELHEETQINIRKPRLVIVEHAGNPYGDQYIYLCEYINGEPKLLEGSEESHINRIGNNIYEPMWVELSILHNRKFLSEKLKSLILHYCQTDWPEAPVEI